VAYRGSRCASCATHLNVAPRAQLGWLSLSSVGIVYRLCERASVCQPVSLYAMASPMYLNVPVARGSPPCATMAGHPRQNRGPLPARFEPTSCNCNSPVDWKVPGQAVAGSSLAGGNTGTRPKSVLSASTWASESGGSAARSASALSNRRVIHAVFLGQVSHVGAIFLEHVIGHQEKDR
jgi:hypothetical protein